MLGTSQEECPYPCTQGSFFGGDDDDDDVTSVSLSFKRYSKFLLLLEQDNFTSERCILGANCFKDP